MTRITVLAVVLSATLGCGQQATTTPGGLAESPTAVSFNPAGAPTIEFSVPDMMCPDSCAVKTKEILAEQAGAKDVYVDFETKTATVAVEDGTFDAEQALAALVDHGFDQSTLKAGAAARPQAADETAVQ